MNANATSYCQIPIFTENLSKCRVKCTPNANFNEQANCPSPILKEKKAKDSLKEESIVESRCQLKHSAETYSVIPFCKSKIKLNGFNNLLNEHGKIPSNVRSLNFVDLKMGSSCSRLDVAEMHKNLLMPLRSGKTSPTMFQTKDKPLSNLLTRASSDFMATNFLEVTEMPQNNLKLKIGNSNLSLGKDSAKSSFSKVSLRNPTSGINDFRTRRNIFCKNVFKVRDLQNSTTEFEIFNPFSYQSFGSDSRCINYDDFLEQTLKNNLDATGENIETSSCTTITSTHSGTLKLVSPENSKSVGYDVIAIVTKQMRIICDSNSGKTYAFFPIPLQCYINDGSCVKITMSQPFATVNDEDNSTLLSQIFQMKEMDNVNFTMNVM